MSHFVPLNLPKLSFLRQGFYILLSFFLVSLGQPAWSSVMSILAGFGGYALFWRAMWGCPAGKQRFWLAMAWFTAVQLVQLSWFVSHPFLYIYIVYFFFAIAMGLQFGAVSYFITPERVVRLPQIAVIASAWTVMEWLRLFLLTGFTFNPAGLALSANIYSLQTASLWGVYGMTFYLVVTNLLALRGWLYLQKNDAVSRSIMPLCSWIFVALLPYIYGFFALSFHEKSVANSPTIDVLLVQTGFVPEELIDFSDGPSSVSHVMNEWRQILRILSKYKGKHTDLIVMPEGLVPYETYYAMYPYSEVRKAFHDIMGPESVAHLPRLVEHLAMTIRADKGSKVLVNNAFWLQAISNLFHTPVIAGLEDHEEMPNGKKEIYNAALTFFPGIGAPQRYEKRVLLPLGEYMPFEFCKPLIERYGIGGSFTCGKKAKVIQGTKIPVTVSICYEETFGHLMRENRLIGGELLVNVTNDAWYPNSKLPQQHFDLARLRTVENGMPLVRSCSTGVTAAVDSLGQIVGKLEAEDGGSEWLSEGLLVKVPIYTYTTLYTYMGDDLVIGACWLVIIAAFGSSTFSRDNDKE